MSREKIANYEVLEKILIGNNEIIFAVNESKADRKYMCCEHNVADSINAYKDVRASNQFLDIMEVYGEKIIKAVKKEKDISQRFDLSTKDKLTKLDCIETKSVDELKGKVIAVACNRAPKGERRRDRQLFLIIDVVRIFAKTDSKDDEEKHILIGLNLNDELLYPIRKREIIGEVKPESVPSWARKRFIPLMDKEDIFDKIINFEKLEGEFNE